MLLTKLLYLGVRDGALRFFMADGEIVPTLEESTKATQQRAEAAQARNEALSAKLRELGVDPDEV